MNQQPIRVFVCDDHEAFADGIRMWLKPPLFKFAGKATSATQCLQRVGRVDVDIILLDIRMGADRLAGIKVAEELQKTFNGTSNPPRIAFLSGFNDDIYLQRSRELGCSFLNKDLPMNDILRSLEQIHCENKIVYHFSGPVSEPKPVVDQLQQRLSPKQGQVACLLAKYHQNQKIAEVLNTSTMNVNTHLRDIYRALGLSQLPNNREKLIVMVVQSGLLNHLEEIMAQPRQWFGRRLRRA